MARYRQLIVQGETGWYLMNPRNPWEAMKLAWYLWRYPDRVGALVGVSKEFMLAKYKPKAGLLRNVRKRSWHGWRCLTQIRRHPLTPRRNRDDRQRTDD